MTKETYKTGDGGFVTIKETPDRVDVYVGDKGSSVHDHLYNDTKTGESGTVHRGGCDECKGGKK